MNVLVAGATGNTGMRVVSEVLDRGHHPIALVRESSDTSSLPADVTLRKGDLADLPDNVCQGCEAIVFAAGSGGDTNETMTNEVDRDGAKALTDMAAQAGLSRFVMLSSAGADNPESAGSDMRHYMQAKHDADEHLKASSLPYAIIRPVTLTDEDGSRDYILGDSVSTDGQAARGDVAAVLVDAIDSDRWLGETVLMQSR